MKFTTRSIDALRSKGDRYEVWEPTVRASDCGLRSRTESWVYLVSVWWQTQAHDVWGIPEDGPSGSHETHAKARKLLDKGIDPGTVEQQAKAEYRDADSVAELAHQYLEKHAKKEKRSWKLDERMLNLDVLPAWGKRKARDITRRDIIALLDNIVDRGAPASANRTLAVISKMFKFGVRRDIVPATHASISSDQLRKTEGSRVDGTRNTRLLVGARQIEHRQVSQVGP